MSVKQDFLSRVLNKVEITPSGCWLWKGKLFKQGYASIWINGKDRRGHVWTYAHFYGPTPQGKVLDHLCRNRHCINPVHLEPVTPKENAMRSPIMGQHLKKINGAKTHCPKGHEYTPENIVAGKGRRKCKACHRERERNRRLQLAPN